MTFSRSDCSASIGVGDQAAAAGPVEAAELRVEILVGPERRPPQHQVDQLTGPADRTGEIEVDQGVRAGVAKDDVLRGDVLVADEFRWVDEIGQAWWLDRCREIGGDAEAGDGIVVPADQPCDGDHPVLVRDPRWTWAAGDLAVDVREHLAAGGVDTEEAWSSVESDRLQVGQYVPDELPSLAARAPYGVADPDQAFGHVAAGEWNLVLVVHSSPFRSVKRFVLTCVPRR